MRYFPLDDDSPGHGMLGKGNGKLRDKYCQRPDFAVAGRQEAFCTVSSTAEQHSQQREVGVVRPFVDRNWVLDLVGNCECALVVRNGGRIVLPMKVHVANVSKNYFVIGNGSIFLLFCFRLLQQIQRLLIIPEP